MDEPMTPNELADYLDSEVEEEFICYHCKANHHEACVGVSCMCPCEVYGRCATCREGVGRVRETLPDGEVIWAHWVRGQSGWVCQECKEPEERPNL